MFLRSVKSAHGRHEYLRLAENYRQAGKIRQRVVLHLRRKDLLAPHFDALSLGAILDSVSGSLDDLVARKAQIETALWQQLRDLFSLEPELVFYDLTSSYFEGQGPAQLACFGYSRDQRPRNPQALIGAVMMKGWPIAHHVFAGNRLDQTTVAEVLEELGQRFGLKRIVLVGDRGMVTLSNIAYLRQAGHGYLVGLQRRNRKDVPHYIEQAVARGR